MRDCALDTGFRGAVSECIPAETAATAIRHRVAAVRSTRAAALGREALAGGGTISPTVASQSVPSSPNMF